MVKKNTKKVTKASLSVVAILATALLFSNSAIKYEASDVIKWVDDGTVYCFSGEASCRRAPFYLCNPYPIST